MPSHFVKIYGTILGSSIWAETLHTRIVWITMLAMADQNGRVEASLGGLARFANVSPDECRQALDVLASPDPDSRTPDHEGRRIERVDGGWRIYNYLKYRDFRSPKQVAEAERKAKYRGRDMSQLSPAIRTEVEVEVDREKEKEQNGAFRVAAQHPQRHDTGEASVLLSRIRSLAVSNGVAGHASAKIIRRDAVGELGGDILVAYDAVGGSERILTAKGKDHSFLARDFAAALATARLQQ